MKKIITLTFLLIIGSCSKEQACNEDQINIITDPNTIEMNWVNVEGGIFEMGCTTEQVNGCSENESPLHKVKLDEYMISKFEVTNEQFVLFLNSQEVVCNDQVVRVAEEAYLYHTNDIKYTEGLFEIEDNLKNHPVNPVTWYGAKAFCEWVGGRLPTEAEWEFAARGGNKSEGFVFSGSNNYEDVGQVTKYHLGTYEIGTLAANELGIYDMSGNAAEWCNDYYDDQYYSESPEDNPQGPEDGENRSVRTSDAQDEFTERVAYRLGRKPNSLYYNIDSNDSFQVSLNTGCRCVKDI